MPIYKYCCKNCGHIFQKLYLTFKEAEIKKTVKCPKCKNDAERIFSSAPAGINKRISEDSEEYREMHYYEKKKDWNRAARAAEGISQYAKNEFLRRAEGK